MNPNDGVVVICRFLDFHSLWMVYLIIVLLFPCGRQANDRGKEFKHRIVLEYGLKRVVNIADSSSSFHSLSRSSIVRLLARSLAHFFCWLK